LLRAHVAKHSSREITIFKSKIYLSRFRETFPQRSQEARMAFSRQALAMPLRAACSPSTYIQLQHTSIQRIMLEVLVKSSAHFEWQCVLVRIELLDLEHEVPRKFRGTLLEACKPELAVDRAQCTPQISKLVLSKDLAIFNTVALV
jgi:hypothetical protein